MGHDVSQHISRFRQTNHLKEAMPPEELIDIATLTELDELKISGKDWRIRQALRLSRPQRSPKKKERPLSEPDSNDYPYTGYRKSRSH